MSIFDVLTGGGLGSVLDTIAGKGGGLGSMLESLGGKSGGGFGSVLDSLSGQSGGGIGAVLNEIGRKAKNTAGQIADATPGGLGGLAGAGALGAIFGNVLKGDIMKSVALAGAGAVAWNFYKKWAQSQNQQAGQAPQIPGGNEHPATAAGWGDTVPAKGIDPTAELVIRSMIYAARADGNIDAEEQARIDAVLQNMLPGQDTSGVVQRIRNEAIDPNKIAVAVGSPEQAEDVYRLSCSVIDIDHFMEQSYTQALAQALGLSQAKKEELEQEAESAKKALMASLKQYG